MAHVQRQIFILILSVLIAASEHLCGRVARASDDHIVKQVVVFREPGRFAGWPANHGIWCWGDEILVGFSRGYHKDLGEGRHNIDREKPEEFLMARSLDGGETWTAEFPNAKGQLIPQGKALHGTEIPGLTVPPLRKCTEAINFKHPDFAMTLRMDNIDGGHSRFYYSYDRGNNWVGPFELSNMGTPGVAARTDYIVDGQHEATFLLTAAKSNHKEGRVFCARTTDGGQSFKFVSWVNQEIDGYEIMPSSVRLSPMHLLTTTRVREPNSGPSWIDTYESLDNGISWTFLNRPVKDTGEGNPSSMIVLADGRICLTYGYRATPFQMFAKLSSDNGKTWGDEILLRTDGGGRDIGYPRSIQTADGKVVTTYYFWDKASGPERFIAATIWDPSKIP
jgi:hypothetical protein